MYPNRSTSPRARWSLPISQRFVFALGLVAAIGAATILSAQERAASEAALLDKKLMAEAKSGSEIMKNLQYLSDMVGPRLTGSENLKRANEYTAEVMRKYGLSNVHLEPWEIP